MHEHEAIICPKRGAREEQQEYGGISAEMREIRFLGALPARHGDRRGTIQCPVTKRTDHIEPENRPGL